MRVARIGLAGVLLLAACAPAAPAAPATSPTVKVASDAKLGQILASADGKTLYTFGKDSPNTSACYEACARNWPPFNLRAGEPVAPADLKGKLGTAARTDGARQVTYNGQPLYLFVGDQKAGDATGDATDAFGGKWSVVKNP